MTAPKTAMVLAAGLGTRMRPLSDTRPKALIEVAGKALIDHMLDRLAAAGVERAVVNLHAFADMLQSHLADRQGAPEIIISEERDFARETGGGVKRARSYLGEDPIWVANIDSVWAERGMPALGCLAKTWDPELMDACLLLTPTLEALGFDGPGDFFMQEGRLSPRKSVAGAATAPFAYVGVHITQPGPIYEFPEEIFSLVPLWVRMSEQARLYGAVLDGEWMHVGDPEARDAAEGRLRQIASR